MTSYQRFDIERFREELRRGERKTFRWMIAIFGGVFLAGIALGIWMIPHSSKQERAAQFMKSCAAADFSAKQCALLFALAEDAADRADDAALLSASALALSAGALTRH